MNSTELEKLRQRSWDRALYAHGTAWAFEKRASKYRRLLRAVAFLGILVPLSVGGTVMAFGADAEALGWVLLIAGILSICQIILSAWSLVSKWDDRLSQSVYSLERNTHLKLSWKRLAESANEELEREFDLLLREDEFQEKHDVKQDFSEKEKRKMMRAGLREFQRKCIECKKVPSSMKSSDCSICGNF